MKPMHEDDGRDELAEERPDRPAERDPAAVQVGHLDPQRHLAEGRLRRRAFHPRVVGHGDRERDDVDQMNPTDAWFWFDCHGRRRDATTTPPRSDADDPDEDAVDEGGGEPPPEPGVAGVPRRAGRAPRPRSCWSARRRGSTRGLPRRTSLRLLASGLFWSIRHRVTRSRPVGGDPLTMPVRSRVVKRKSRRPAKEIFAGARGAARPIVMDRIGLETIRRLVPSASADDRLERDVALDARAGSAPGRSQRSSVEPARFSPAVKTVPFGPWALPVT